MTAELDEFRGLSLLLQHRFLVERLDAIEHAISVCQSAERTDRETAVHLLPLVRGFAQALPAHFADESKSTTALLSDCSDVEFSRALTELDTEHPRLLASFEAAVERLARYFSSVESASDVPFEQAIAELLTAIGEFRAHEAKEDALFAN